MQFLRMTKNLFWVVHFLCEYEDLLVLVSLMQVWVIKCVGMMIL